MCIAAISHDASKTKGRRGDSAPASWRACKNRIGNSAGQGEDSWIRAVLPRRAGSRAEKENRRHLIFRALHFIAGLAAPRNPSGAGLNQVRKECGGKCGAQRNG
jgi:hypothetical protein